VTRKATGDGRAGAPPFRVAAASLSGRSDAGWARAALPQVDAAVLGGIAVDEPTRAAARGMVDREREEFLPPDPVAFVDDQLAALEGAPLVAGFNVRAVDPGPVRRVATVCADRDAVLEVNAHCRQAEMCAAGAGEALLGDPGRLAEQVTAAAATGATVSVKVRTELSGVDLPAVAARAADAGADLLHVDAMDSEAVVADVVRALGGDPERPGPDDRAAHVVANNEVRDRASVREYLGYGADAVSVGRSSDDPAVLARVRDAVEEWVAEVPA
jgi:TIM-barrel protein